MSFGCIHRDISLNPSWPHDTKTRMAASSRTAA